MNTENLRKNNPLLLCLETAGSSCSVCLASGSQVLFEKEEKEAYKHNELLAYFTREVLKDSGTEIGELTAIVINQGPGSYTGLRVGFAFGKALSFASGKPLYTVSGLEGMSHVAVKTAAADLYVPMLDARRMEVYCAVYDAKVNEVEPPSVVELNDSFFQRELFLKKRVLLLGEAAEKTAALTLPEGFSIMYAELKASNLILPALEKIKYPPVDPAYTEPLYLKEARITTSKKTLM